MQGAAAMLWQGSPESGGEDAGRSNVQGRVQILQMTKCIKCRAVCPIAEPYQLRRRVEVADAVEIRCCLSSKR